MARSICFWRKVGEIQTIFPPFSPFAERLRPRRWTQPNPTRASLGIPKNHISNQTLLNSIILSSLSSAQRHRHILSFLQLFLPLFFFPSFPQGGFARGLCLFFFWGSSCHSAPGFCLFAPRRNNDNHHPELKQSRASSGGQRGMIIREKSETTS